MPRLPFDHNKVFRGTYGRVWLDGERLADIKKFEVKVTMKYEDMDVNGKESTQQRYMGYSIEGTMTLHKFDSYIVSKILAGLKSGDMKPITMTTGYDDPSAVGAERFALSDVKFSEVTLVKFENKGLSEEEFPFTAGDFDPLDLAI